MGAAGTPAQRGVTLTAAMPPTICVLERGWVSSNNILLFDDEDSATLIDTGYVAHNEQTLQLVRHALNGRRLARVINTHLHSDHCGGNALLKRELGATIVIPHGHADAVESWDQAKLGYSACGQACERFMYDALIEPGQRISIGGTEWQAFASPGHDPDSIVLWNARDRTLISADALWQHGFGAIFAEVEGRSGFAEQRAILQLMSALAPQHVIPGHGAPFTDVEPAFERAFERLEALEAMPERNARHVIKTLIKFHLLIVRQITLPALIAHFRGTYYAETINQRYFGLPFETYMRRMVEELAAGGAVELRNEFVINRD